MMAHVRLTASLLALVVVTMPYLPLNITIIKNSSVSNFQGVTIN
ncbi:MAG: hypothetical protein ACJAWH_001639 [Maribacter sp.]|jgi:hypothetical protein